LPTLTSATPSFSLACIISRHQQLVAFTRFSNTSTATMFETLRAAVASALPSSDDPFIDHTRASPTGSTCSVITVEASNALSSSSTPPTSIGDSGSVSSSSMKIGNTLSIPAEESSSRSRRSRTSISTYNVKVLSGTSIHAPKKFSKNNEENKMRRRTISGDTLVGVLDSGNSSTETVEKDAKRLVSDGIKALDLEWSVKKLQKSKSQIGLSGSSSSKAKRFGLRRKSTRSAGERIETITKSISGLGKRGRDTFESGLTKVKRELRNLADTDEYAKIDTKPVLLEVWSNGKLVPLEPPKKRKKVEEPAAVKPNVEEEEPVVNKTVARPEKVWLTKGLYAGQDAKDLDWFAGSKKAAPTDNPTAKFNKTLPMPMWHGQRLLQIGRDFKLPYDVCSPLPPGQPKPDEWRKTSSSKIYLSET
jgi:histone-lysine N-methyltransferase ASH1L